ncbi:MULTISPECIES: hypothetical protein [unclassified Synechocystis]|uniref:DUF6887 family protein n=1 Tax=unclassified Synechocystis TaxID=2640012 RepID=UPI00040870C4|nr:MULTISPECIES: hypothetical protein [unclassified Synechocystis]MCT0254508.1 hypothetical protein [Synechocystis sp. CS-94]
MKTKFQAMTIKQLKQYVLEHREDQDAFEVFMDRLDSQPAAKIYDGDDVAQFAEILKQHHNS